MLNFRRLAYLVVILMVTACSDDLVGPNTDYTRISICFPPDTIWIVLYKTDTTAYVSQKCFHEMANLPEWLYVARKKLEARKDDE